MKKYYREQNAVLANQFIQAADLYGPSPALKLKGFEYTYNTLKQNATAIALQILEREDKTHNVVAVWGSPSLAAYAGIPGILMASCAYVPMNPRFPTERNLFVYERSGAEILVLGPEDFEEVNRLFTDYPRKPLLIFSGNDTLPEGLANSGFKYLSARPSEKNDIPGITSRISDMAYLMFTSGSTGIPKGVPVSNGNVLAYLDNLATIMNFSPSDRFSQTFDLTFDLSVHDLFACWLSGACLCIPDERYSLTMAKYLRKEKISVWFSVPSLAVLMQKMRLLKENAFPDLRYSLFCGEPLLLETATVWALAAPASKLFNLYGPTETTIAISAYHFNPAEGHSKSRNGILSIGKIFPGHLTGFGSREEDKILNISGPQVVNGYFNDEKAANDSFSCVDGLTWYNTGDRVEKDADGDMFFLGRNDHEIKISGYRVNILEIEHAIREKCGKNAVAIPLRNDDETVKEIVAFIEDPLNQVKEEELRHALTLKLPWYMIPASFRKLEKFPLNQNLKIDRKKLEIICFS
ncbi:MAG: AMP-binding protein [Bacteroidetes bacterium]|nr:AMP-binding protein [Bacteroidota bacterium]